MLKYDIEGMQKQILEMMKATIEVCDKNDITYYCQAGTVLGAIRHKGQIPWDADADLIIPDDQIDRFVECAEKDLPDKYYVDYFKTNPKGLRIFPRVGLKGYSTNVLHLDIFRLIGLPDDPKMQEELLCEGEVYRDRNRTTHCSFFHLLKSRQPLKALCHPFYLLFTKDKYARKMDELCRRYPYSEATYVMNPFGKYRMKNVFNKEVYGAGIMVPFADFEARVPVETDLYLKQYYKDYMKYPSQEYIDKIMKKTFVIKEI